VLTVLDGADDEEQVFPLLPGTPGCLVVVTSRQPMLRLMAALGAHHVRLGPLSDREARDYLVKVLGRQRVEVDPAAVDTLVGRHGGVPGALAMAAARITLEAN
jgi:hypothetical protein